MISKQGEYNTREAIRNISKENEEEDKEIWKKVWTQGLISKITFFMWLLDHNKLATIDKLKKKGMILPNRCHLCKEQEESINHIFVYCTFATRVQNEIRAHTCYQGVMLEKARDWIVQWSPMKTNKYKEMAWYVILTHLLWKIWKE